MRPPGGHALGESGRHGYDQSEVFGGREEEVIDEARLEQSQEVVCEPSLEGFEEDARESSVEGSKQGAFKTRLESTDQYVG